MSNDLLNDALRDFSFHLANIEIDIFKQRKIWRNLDQMSAYFQSTPEKAVFSRVMYSATCLQQAYTVSEISLELGVSRQTISKICKETVEAGWIICAKFEKRLTYQASKILCDSIIQYADYNSDLFLDSPVHDAEHFLGMLKKGKAALHRRD